MSDDADRAQDHLVVEVAAALSRIDAAIPAGVPGECDDCGEDMPRLVGGRCAFCRDGRRPALSTFDRLPQPAPAITSREEKPVATYKDGKYVSVPCEKRVLRAIERRAAAYDVALGVAALDLIEAGIRAVDAPAPAAIEPTRIETVAEPHDGSDASIAAWLEHVSNALLAQELQRRMGAGVSDEEHAAALARAEAAEGRWASLQQQLRGLVGEPA